MRANVSILSSATPLSTVECVRRKVCHPIRFGNGFRITHATVEVHGKVIIRDGQLVM